VPLIRIKMFYDNDWMEYVAALLIIMALYSGQNSK